MFARVFADGCCSGNPGPGGYAAIVRVEGRADLELSDGRPATTNNQMELAAVRAGLGAARELGATDVEVVSDSQYVVKGMTQWIHNWVRKGWRTTTGPVANREAWESLLELTRDLDVRWTWVQGHAGHPENERCDELCKAAMAQQTRAARRW